MGPNGRVPCVGYVGFAHIMLWWPSAAGVDGGSQKWKCVLI